MIRRNLVQELVKLHFEVKVGGGRDDVPWELRWPRVLEAKDRLVAAGATVVK